MTKKQGDMEFRRSTRLPSYVVISPVRDEVDFIEKTLRSVTEQTIKPAEWIIVNDGSTDGTEVIVASYVEQYDWIRLVNCENRGYRQRGPGVVEAFYSGFEQISQMDYDVVVKLDGDLSFEPNYFERLLDEFAKNPRLGIASGQPYEFINGEWATGKALHNCTQGPTKLYRRACFEEIGGIPRSLGWDGIDDWIARMHGWQTITFENIHLLHYRNEGAATGILKARVEQGRGAYFMGYHPLYMLARCTRRLVTKPYLVGAVAMLWGYLSSWFFGKEQVEPKLVHYIQHHQMQMLISVTKSILGVQSGRLDKDS